MPCLCAVAQCCVVVVRVTSSCIHRCLFVLLGLGAAMMHLCIRHLFVSAPLSVDVRGAGGEGGGNIKKSDVQGECVITPPAESSEIVVLVISARFNSLSLASD